MEIRTIKRTQEVTSKQRAKIIRKMDVARRILSLKEELGIDVSVIDLKPDRTDPDHKRSVVVFRDDENFQKVFSQVVEQINKERTFEKDEEIRSLKEELAELKKQIAEKE